MGISIRTLKKTVRELKSGESIYINSIGLSINSIEALRTMVMGGVLIPDSIEAEKVYKRPEDIMNGKVIFPQMTYVKA